MQVRETEAIILRTYPFNEADKIVSFFSRGEGRTRGVARNARRSVKRFGGALELLSHVRVRYSEQGARELVRMENCELLDSFFDAQSNYAVAVASSYLAEICEQLLPEREVNDPFFRLVLLVISEIRRTGQIWRPLTYFDLWAVKLAGFLPGLTECADCGVSLDANDADQDEAKPTKTWDRLKPVPTFVWFRAHGEGLLCQDCKGEAAWTLSHESRALALRMLASPLSAIPDPWTKQRGEDLRRFLNQQIERHLERKLVTRHQLDLLPE